MTDYLLGLSSHPLAKKLVRQLRLPIPLPEPLKRAGGCLEEHPLEGQEIAVGSLKPASLAQPLAELLTAAGAHPVTVFTPDVRLDALVFDASEAQTTADLDALYEFLRPRLSALKTCGRVLLLGTPPALSRTPEAAACAYALTGLVKSLAKEIGRRGCTAQVLQIAADARTAGALAAPLRFFLSRRSAFVSGQTLEIGRSAEPAGAPQTATLAGKVALVTGAAQGIGAAIAAALAAEGAKVICLDRPAEQTALDQVARRIDGVAYAFDLLSPEAPRQIAARLESDFGAIDILVNNAGITRDKTLARMPADWWHDVLAINLAAPIRLTETLANGAAELIKLLNPGGRLIYLSSVGGIAGNAGQTNYAAAKAGLIGYVRAIAPQLAARGITVNAVAPGFIETRMTKSMPAAMREVARRFNSLNQAGMPEDVADAVCFLALPGSGGVSGQVLRVCGQNLIGA